MPNKLIVGITRGREVCLSSEKTTELARQKWADSQLEVVRTFEVGFGLASEEVVVPILRTLVSTPSGLDAIANLLTAVHRDGAQSERDPNMLL